MLRTAAIWQGGVYLALALPFCKVLLHTWMDILRNDENCQVNLQGRQAPQKEFIMPEQANDKNRCWGIKGPKLMLVKIKPPFKSTSSLEGIWSQDSNRSPQPFWQRRPLRQNLTLIMNLIKSCKFRLKICTPNFPSFLISFYQVHLIFFCFLYCQAQLSPSSSSAGWMS